MTLVASREQRLAVGLHGDVERVDERVAAAPSPASIDVVLRERRA